MRMQLPHYLTTQEVAAYLRLKERTVYELVSRKAIPCSRVSGKLIFPRRLIDRWVDANVELAQGPALVPPPIVGGSSDPLLEWALRESGSALATLFEGSTDGLARFAEGQVVAVGLHLGQAGEDDHNLKAIRGLAGVHDVVLIEWAERDQGLVVARGNPRGIQGLGDLAASRVRIAVRQQGAGARILFDALLASAGIDPATLSFCDRPARTEADVAAAVADGEADCGLAIGAVAKQFGLGFVPLHRERFDLAVRRRDYFEASLQRLFAFARSPAFSDKAAQLGHYGIERNGTVRFNA